MKSGVCIELESLSEQVFGAPGLGNCACCEMDHCVKQKDGTTVEISCDKVRIAEVLRHILDYRLSDLIKCNDIFSYQWFRSIYEPIIMRGLEAYRDPGHFPRPTSVDEFLQQFRFGSINEGVLGWTPLRYAVISQNVQLVRSLLELKADVAAETVLPLQRDMHLRHSRDILQWASCIRALPAYT